MCVCVCVCRDVRRPGSSPVKIEGEKGSGGELKNPDELRSERAEACQEKQSTMGREEQKASHLRKACLKHHGVIHGKTKNYQWNIYILVTFIYIYIYIYSVYICN